MHDPFHRRSIESCYRLGKAKSGRSRLLKVRFDDVDTKFEIIRSQRVLRQDPEIRAAFGNVYINHDSTPLVRKEERRLRIKMRELTSGLCETDRLYIRGGSLYKNGTIVDTINVSNQLFTETNKT